MLKVKYMNPKTKQIEMKDAEDVSFTPVTIEPVLEYKLEDGNVIKVKHSLVRVVKVIGETTEDGAPVYQILENGSLTVLKKD